MRRKNKRNSFPNKKSFRMGYLKIGTFGTRILFLGRTNLDRYKRKPKMIGNNGISGKSNKVSSFRHWPQQLWLRIHEFRSTLKWVPKSMNFLWFLERTAYMSN
ncbi:hypothetical protein AAHE18_13G198600 [Arachis hypogaea]